MGTFDFGCVNVGFCWVDVGFWLLRRWVLVVWTLDFGCMDVGFGLNVCWIVR